MTQNFLVEVEKPMEEEKPTNQPTPEPPITLTIPHDAAVAIGAAVLHYRALITFEAEMAPTIQQLDDVYRLIVQHAQLPSTTRAFLQDMRWHVTGLKDKPPEGGRSDATASRAES